MPHTFGLGRVAGIPIAIHYTWLIAAAVLSWSLAESFFPTTSPGWTHTAYWAAGIIAALTLFASVLLHELGHSLVARARGVRVESITLFIFGGVAQMRRDVEHPMDDFLVGIAGPLTSLVLAAVFWESRWLVLGSPAALAVLGYLGFVNLLLGAFNLVPGFPLDGGRVLRAILWGLSGQRGTSTRIASYIGQGVGWLLIAWGILRVFSGDLFGGLWTGMIGFFLTNAAQATRRAERMAEQLRGLHVSDLMTKTPATTIPAPTTLPLRVAPATARVADEDDETLTPDTDVIEAAQVLLDTDEEELPVVDHGHVVGVLSRDDIAEVLDEDEDEPHHHAA